MHGCAHTPLRPMLAQTNPGFAVFGALAHLLGLCRHVLLIGGKEKQVCCKGWRDGPRRSSPPPAVRDVPVCDGGRASPYQTPSPRPDSLRMFPSCSSFLLFFFLRDVLGAQRPHGSNVAAPETGASTGNPPRAVTALRGGGVLPRGRKSSSLTQVLSRACRTEAKGSFCRAHAHIAVSHVASFGVYIFILKYFYKLDSLRGRQTTRDCGL